VELKVTNNLGMHRKKALDLDLTPEDQRPEDNFKKGAL